MAASSFLAVIGAFSGVQALQRLGFLGFALFGFALTSTSEQGDHETVNFPPDQNQPSH